MRVVSAVKLEAVRVLVSADAVTIEVTSVVWGPAVETAPEDEGVTAIEPEREGVSEGTAERDVAEEGRTPLSVAEVTGSLPESEVELVGRTFEAEFEGVFDAVPEGVFEAVPEGVLDAVPEGVFDGVWAAQDELDGWPGRMCEGRSLEVGPAEGSSEGTREGV